MSTLVSILRWLLLPVVPIYFIVTWLRNKLYDAQFLKSKSYPLPIVCVGNLSTGGTGKTPMVEYLIRMLGDDYKLAVLSRGYKRKSKGFVLATENANSGDLGDEPYQIFKKFTGLTLAVDSNRHNGIERLMSISNPDVILLDDAYQHRKVKAGFNILLSAYGNLYSNDLLLPTGNLREPKSGAQRATIIVVTKCPIDLSEKEKNQIIQSLGPHKKQSVFFSNIAYSKSFYSNEQDYSFDEIRLKPFTLVTGIANPRPLIHFLEAEKFKFDHLEFPDHHNFSNDEIQELNRKDVVVTTEKDFVRLQGRLEKSTLLVFLPISTEIDSSIEFNRLIREYIVSHSQN